MNNKTFTRLLFFLTILVHGPLLFVGFFKKSYDAYTHIFLAQHYLKIPWDSWNDKWYGGFDQFSYLPLSHETIAIFSSWFGLLGAYTLVQLFLLIAVVWGIYRFSRLWVEEEQARLCSVLGIFLTSLAQSVYQYGQFPTIFSLGFLLHSTVFAHHWLKKGNTRDLCLAILMLMMVATSHHMTLCMASFIFFGAVFAESLLTAHSEYRLGECFKRMALLVFPTAFLAGLLVSPFLFYISQYNTDHVTIYHASRSDFLKNSTVLFSFFLIPHSYSLVFVPFSSIVFFKNVKMRPLFVIWLITFILGMGGTTPAIHLLPRALAETITFERFTIWATILFLPIFVEGLKQIFKINFKYIRWVVLGIAVVCFSTLLVNIAIFPFQPKPLNLKPIVQFLESQKRHDFRYLTLGFGSQSSYLNILSEAPTIDGNYNFARRIPELTQSGIELLDGAKYYDKKGMQTLDFFLGYPKKYALRYVFCNDHFYDEILKKRGWKKITTFENGVDAWFSSEYSIGNDLLVQKTSYPGWMYWMWRLYPYIFMFAFVVICGFNRIRPALKGIAVFVYFLALWPLFGLVLGTYFWWADLFSHWLVLSAVIFFIYLIYAFLRQKLKLAVLALLSLAVSVIPLISYNPVFLPLSGEIESREFNVFYANACIDNKTPERLVDAIKAEAPDIVAIVEYNYRIQGVFERQRLLKKYPYQKEVVQENNFGILLLSKFKIRDIQVKYYDLDNVPTLRAVLMIENKPVVFWLTHPVPPINSHGWMLRNSQWSKICTEISQEVSPVILAGDMNMSSWSSWFSTAKRAGLRDSNEHLGLGQSWPSILPWFLRIPIDHVLVSKNIRVLESRMPDFYVGSDHLPIKARLALQKSN